MKESKTRDFLSQIGSLFRRDKMEAQKKLQSFLEQAEREPMNATASLKAAEIYQQFGEKQNALSQYLRAAELFCDSEQYHKGLAIYTKVLKENPECELAKLQLADNYKKMGFLAQAFAQYQSLYCSYIISGAEDKALEMIGFMADLDSEKFNLGEANDLAPHEFEEIKGQATNENSTEINLDRPLQEERRSFFDLATMLEANNPVEFGESKSVTMEEGYKCENIFEEMKQTRNLEKLYLNYNYQMGLVCKEMGLIDEAIKQFQIALEKKQKPIEANKLLGECLKDRGCREKARKSIGSALKQEDFVEDTAITGEIFTAFHPLIPRLSPFDSSTP